MDRGEATGRKLGEDKPKAKPAPPPTLAMSIPQFCTSHNISEGMYYKMKKQDRSLIPREMKVGTRTLITFEAAAQWRAERQAASVVEHKAQPAPPAKTVTPPTKVRRPEPLEHVEKPEPEQTRPAEPELLEPKAWLAWARKEYPKQQNERSIAYIRRLHGLMQKADNVTEVWEYENFRRRYYEAVKADQSSCAKSAQVSARCLSCCGFMRVQKCANALLICTFCRPIIGGMKTHAPTPTIPRRAVSVGPPERKIKVREAAAFNDLSEATFRRHYRHLIRKITPRRDRRRARRRHRSPPPQTKTA